MWVLKNRLKGGCHVQPCNYIWGVMSVHLREIHTLLIPCECTARNTDTGWKFLNYTWSPGNTSLMGIGLKRTQHVNKAPFRWD